jgi:hypothetical protein
MFIQDGQSTVRIAAKKAVFYFSKMSRPAVGPSQPPTEWYAGSFLGVERSGRVADHSPPSRAKVKSEWSYIFAPSICLMTWTGSDLPVPLDAGTKY